MALHLITVAGGDHNPVLEPMLHHYAALGVDAVHLCVHLRTAGDPALAAIREIANRFGCGIDRVLEGPRELANQELYAQPRREYSNDWFLLADTDEFQHYPMDVRDLIAECDRRGWDHVRGCFVDRLAADGSFPEIQPGGLDEQFPLGALLTFPLFGGDPRKVTLVKGALHVKHGQHLCYGQALCPPEFCYTPVHHFKWDHTVLQRIRERLADYRGRDVGHWPESARFLEAVDNGGGRLDITNPKFYAAPAVPAYSRWEEVKAFVLARS